MFLQNTLLFLLPINVIIFTAAELLLVGRKGLNNSRFM